MINYSNELENYSESNRSIAMSGYLMKYKDLE